MRIVDACPPMAEKLFKPLIEDSYVDNMEFQLELTAAEAAAVAALMRHECGLEMGFTSGFDTRGLDPWDLGGVVFGCFKDTVKECLVSKLFGLPRQHYGYVRHVRTGMPIFLFNAGDAPPPPPPPSLQGRLPCAHSPPPLPLMTTPSRAAAPCDGCLAVDACRLFDCGALSLSMSEAKQTILASD